MNVVRTSDTFGTQYVMLSHYLGSLPSPELSRFMSALLSELLQKLSSIFALFSAVDDDVLGLIGISFSESKIEDYFALVVGIMVVKCFGSILPYKMLSDFLSPVK